MRLAYTAAVLLPWTEIVSLLIVGFAVGVVGGLLGIGGSIIMIPVLAICFGRDIHLSQAAAMIVNIFVSAAAVVRHFRARAIEWGVALRMTPAGLVFIVIGVAVANRFQHENLTKIFGVFLTYVVIINVLKLFDRGDTERPDRARGNWLAGSFVGSAMGFAAGLLGIGGGIIAVPLLQRICRLPLRRGIAVSATVMCITSAVGAVRKNVALPTITNLDDNPVMMSLIIAACFVPTAIVGGLIGGGLTHTLPLKWIRLALIILLSAASLRFLGVVGAP